MKNNKTIITIIFIILSNIIFMQSSESIHSKKEIAKSYFDAGLYEDAISLYNNILSIQISVLGDYHPGLIATLHDLSDLYIEINDIESSEKHLLKALKIEFNDIIKKQTNYIQTYKKIKSLYITMNDSSKAKEIDSLLLILSSIENDTIVFDEDSFEKYPLVLHYKNDIVDSTNLVSEYSNNDNALELFNTGLMYIDAKLYTEAIQSFDRALKIEAKIINNNYLLNIDFKDSIIFLDYYNTLNDLQNNDTTYTSLDFLIGLSNIKFSKDIKIIENNFNAYSKLHPKDIRPYLILGDMYFNKNDYFNALAYYRTAELIKPFNLHSKLFIGISLYDIKKYEDALFKFQEIIELDNYNYESLYYLGLSYLKLLKYNEAINFFTKALLIDSTDDNLYYYIGLSYNKIGEKWQAQDAYKQAIVINPTNGLAHFELGKIYDSILKFDLAITEYNTAKKYISLDSLNLNLGKLLFNKNKYKESMNPLREYIINNPNDIKVLKMLGHIFMQEKRYPEAIDTYVRLLDMFPHNEEYYFHIAESYYYLENFVDAKEYYEQVLLFNEEDANILLKLGKIANNLYQFKQSEIYLNEALSCSNTSKELLFELGIAYGGQKKYLQALNVFQEALTYSLDDPILHYQLGVVYQALSIYELAIMEYQSYLESHSRDPIVYYMIAESYNGLDKYNDAIKYFKKVLDLRGYKDYKSLYQIGLNYIALQDNKNAAKYFKLSLSANPDHILSRYNLINIYIDLNKVREAKKECDILFMLDRELYNSLYYCSNL